MSSVRLTPEEQAIFDAAVRTTRNGNGNISYKACCEMLTRQLVRERDGKIGLVFGFMGLVLFCLFLFHFRFFYFTNLNYYISLCIAIFIFILVWILSH